VPLGLVTTLGGGALVGLVSKKVRAGAALELGLYATVTCAAAIRYRDQDRPASAVLLAIVYPILHVAYGVGMLRGLWRFRHRFVRPGMVGHSPGPHRPSPGGGFEDSA
jgi:hypothetical protein